MTRYPYHVFCEPIYIHASTMTHPLSLDEIKLVHAIVLKVRKQQHGSFSLPTREPSYGETI